MVTFAFDEETVLPAHGTGVLVPLQTPFAETSESMMITALTFLDRKWPHLRRDGQHLVRAHVGRIDDDRWRGLSDDELRARVAQELRALLPKVGKPLASLVQRWPNGLPQYDAGHEVLVSDAKRAASDEGVFLCGNAYDGVGIPASVGSGRTAARELRGYLGHLIVN
jgi:oxygen-dependent protoporphyrinogen oxidase